MDLSPLYIVQAFIVGIIAPIYGLWGGPKARKLLTSQPDMLISVYRSTIITQIVLVSLTVLIFILNKDSMEIIGLAFVRNGWIVGAVVVVPFLFLWLLYQTQIPMEKLEKLRSEYAEVSYLIPRTRIGYIWCIALSFVAGTCEEILYRGFIFWQLNAHMHMVVAILLTNIIFALLHYGTGMKNAISTFGLGLLFSALSIPFETLWPAILAHILVDIYAATIGFKVNKASEKK